MKRLLPLFLCLVLLCGCAAPAENTVSTEAPTTQATTPEESGLYLASELESQTDGAVRVYQSDPSNALFTLDGKLLTMAQDAETFTLTLWEGENLTPVARYVHEGSCIGVYSAENAVYVQAEHTLFQLDASLRAVREIPLPEAVENVILSQDGSTVFYAMDDCIFAQSVSDGLARLVKEYPVGSSPYLASAIREDQVLQVSYSASPAEFIRVDDGSCLYACEDYVRTISGGNRSMFTLWRDLPEWYLDDGETAQAFVPGRSETLTNYFPQENTAVFDEFDSDSNLVTLRYYNMSTGMLESELSLSGMSVPWDAVFPGDGYIYLLCTEESSQLSRILRWDPKRTPAAGESRLSPIYTQENPDVQGLAQCAIRAEDISRRMGIPIFTGSQAVSVQPWDYTLEWEYRTPLIQDALDTLEEILSTFPEGFFGKLTANYNSLAICIVRSITGDPSSGSITSADGLQYWEGNSGYIALVASGDLRYNVYHELSHLIDSYILGNSNAYDSWNDKNPPEFTYDYNYTSYQDRYDWTYLEDENRAFIDSYSMSYPTEDRARILEYACNPGNAHYFQSSIMQSKLKTICLGIRDAFGLEKYPESFLWEQYLNLSLAYAA